MTVFIPVKRTWHASVQELAEVFQRNEAMYFVVGTRGKDLRHTDVFNVVQSMRVSGRAGILRTSLADASTSYGICNCSTG